MRQLGAALQRVEVGQLGDVVLGEHEGVQVRQALGQARREAGDAVARAQQRVQARRQREVGEARDDVVGEVDGFMVLFAAPGVSIVVDPPRRGGGKSRRGERCAPWRHPDSRWSGFCALFSPMYQPALVRVPVLFRAIVWGGVGALPRRSSSRSRSGLRYESEWLISSAVSRMLGCPDWSCWDEGGRGAGGADAMGRSGRAPQGHVRQCRGLGNAAAAVARETNHFEKG